jgi:hypothetical protein
MSLLAHSMGVHAHPAGATRPSRLRRRAPARRRRRGARRRRRGRGRRRRWRGRLSGAGGCRPSPRTRLRPAPTVRRRTAAPDKPAGAAPRSQMQTAEERARPSPTQPVPRMRCRMAHPCCGTAARQRPRAAAGPAASGAAVTSLACSGRRHPPVHGRKRAATATSLGPSQAGRRHPISMTPLCRAGPGRGQQRESGEPYSRRLNLRAATAQPAAARGEAQPPGLGGAAGGRRGARAGRGRPPS